MTEETVARRELSLLIVDDHAIFREGLRALLDMEEDFVVVGEASRGDEAVAMVYVECDGTPSDRANESSEDIRTLFVGPAEAQALCAATDRRMDVKTWVVLWCFAQSGTI